MLKRVLILSMCFGVALLVVTLAGALVWKTRIGQRTFYTDGQTISMQASQARPREVMWSSPVALPSSINSEFAEFDPQVSEDGLSLLLVRRDAAGDATVYWSKRDDANRDWPQAQPLIELHSHGEDVAPEMSRDGRAIYFASDRAGGFGGLDLWVSRRGDFGWLPPENLGGAVNGPADETSPAIMPDGRQLYFASNRPGPDDVGEQLAKPWPTAASGEPAPNDLDLYVAEIIDGALQHALPLQTLNSDGHDSAPAFSPADDFVYFSSDRAGGFGRLDLYRARLIEGQPQQPVNLGPEINSNENEFDPAISSNGFVLHFASDRPMASASSDRASGVGDANIFQSVSREVYTQLAEGPLFDWASLWAIIGPSVFWLLLALLAIALLLMALAFMRGARAQQLNLLARCLLASLIFHLALMILMTFWQVTTSIGEMLERHGAMQVAIVSSASHQDADELHTQVRGGLTAIEIAADEIELKRALADLHTTLETPNAKLEAERREDDTLDDSLAKRDEPGESESAIEPPIQMQLAQADANQSPDVASPPEPMPLKADEPVQSAQAMKADTQRDRTGEEVPAAKAPPPAASAIAMRPVQAKSIETAHGSMASQQQATEARPTLGAMKQVEPAIAARAEQIEVNAMPAPRKVESRQPELAMAATKTAEAKAHSFTPPPTSADAQAADVPPVATPRTVDSQIMAAQTNVQEAAPPRADLQVATTANVKPNAVAVVVKTESGSRPVEAGEVAVAMNSQSPSNARAQTSKADTPVAQAVTITPHDSQKNENLTSLTAAKTADTASHVQITSGQPTPALELATAMTTDVGTPVESSPAAPSAQTREASLAVAVGAATSATRASTSTASPSTAISRVDVQPATSQQTQEAKSGSLVSNTPASVTAKNPSSPATIDIQSPLAAASPSNAAMPDLATPRGTLPRPTAGEESAPAMQIATAGTTARSDSTPSASTITTQSIALKPVAASSPSNVESASSLMSSALPNASVASTNHALLTSPLQQPMAGSVTSIDVATPATAANNAPHAELSVNQSSIAATGNSEMAKSRADVATPAAAPALAAIALTPNGASQSQAPANSLASAAPPSFNVAIAPPPSADSTSISAPINIREIESVPLALPSGTVDAVIAAETTQIGPKTNALASSQRHDASQAPAVNATPAAIQVEPVATQTQSPHASSMVEIRSAPQHDRSAGEAELSPQPIGQAPMLAMSSPAGLDIKTPQDIAPAENPYPQRAEELRKELVKRGGGSEATEKAVALALEWLSNHQSADGRWAARDFGKSCGECDGRGKFDTDVATTGLTLLCFLGSDHTHMKEGKYREQIQRALDWMLTQQLEDGDWRGGETMYSHGIATIAVCEAYAMTGDIKLKAAVKNAIDYIWAARNRSIGGWRYEPGQVGDTSVLGWQMMAMMSAKRAGFFVPAEAFEMARHWLDLASTPARPGLYGYQPGQRFTPSMTAEGMFIQQLSGRDRNEDRMSDSADFLMQHLPVWRSDQNSYFWYYGTLALFQHQGEHWKKWNNSLTAQLLANQQTEGHEAGSWEPVDNWAKIGGRVYQTALCTLCLEVYYRYLPMYAAVEEDQE